MRSPPSLRVYDSVEPFTELLNSRSFSVPGEVRLHSFLLNLTSGRLRGPAFRLYGFPQDDPIYFFLVELCEKTFAELHVTLPDVPDDESLRIGCKLLLRELREELIEEGVVVFSDQEVVDLFSVLMPEEIPEFVQGLNTRTHTFFMNDLQRKQLAEMELRAPDGFELSAPVKADAQLIHDTWIYGTTLESTWKYAEQLPAVVVRQKETGAPASWELTSSLGALTHLFTHENFRGHRLGFFTEFALAQKLIRDGYGVFKYVVEKNSSVERGTLASPLWTLWRTAEGESRFTVWRHFHRKDGAPRFNSPDVNH